MSRQVQCALLIATLVVLSLNNAAMADFSESIADVETFQTEQVLRVNNLLASTVSEESFVEDGSLIGGERDVRLTKASTEGFRSAQTTLFGLYDRTSGTYMRLATPPDESTAELIYQLDGPDGSMALNKTGLGGTDFFTQHGANGLLVHCSGYPVGLLELRFYDMTGNSAILRRNTPNNQQHDYVDFVSYEQDFVVKENRAFRWSQIGAFEMFVRLGPSGMFIIRRLSVATVA